jgi:anti-anti-sigma regulatory factor
MWNRPAPGPASERIDALGVTVKAIQGELSAVIRGRLTARSVSDSACRILKPIQRLKPREVIIAGSEVTCCDGVGIGLINTYWHCQSILFRFASRKGMLHSQ